MLTTKTIKLSNSNPHLKIDSNLLTNGSNTSNTTNNNAKYNFINKNQSSNILKQPIKLLHQHIQSATPIPSSGYALANSNNINKSNIFKDEASADSKMNTKNHFYNSNNKKSLSLTPDKRDFVKQSNHQGNLNFRSSINTFDPFSNHIKHASGKQRNNEHSNTKTGFISHGASKSLSDPALLISGSESTTNNANSIATFRSTRKDLFLSKPPLDPFPMFNKSENQAGSKNESSSGYDSSYLNHDESTPGIRAESRNGMKKTQSEVRLPKIDDSVAISKKKFYHVQQGSESFKSINNININFNIGNLNIIQKLNDQGITQEGVNHMSHPRHKPKSLSQVELAGAFNRQNDGIFYSNGNTINSGFGFNVPYSRNMNSRPSGEHYGSSLGGSNNNILSPAGPKKTQFLNERRIGTSYGRSDDKKVIKPNETKHQNFMGEDFRKIVQNFVTKSKPGSLPNKPVKTNQDAYIIYPNFSGNKSRFFFAVCDGHGLNGHIVSNLIKQNLPKNIEYHFKIKGSLEDNSVVRHALHAGFLQTNKELLDSAVDCNFSGSTTVSVLIMGTHLWCANVGDSRAIMAKYKNGEWTAVPLSLDHKPDEKSEMQRILASGGRVEPFRDSNGDPIGPYRVWLKNENVPGLAMARSMGDAVASQVGVIHEPEILDYELVEDDKFIVIASDGVWEFLSNQQVMSFVIPYYAKNQLEFACDRLIKESTQCWKQEDEVVDDITCVIIQLKVPAKQSQAD